MIKSILTLLTTLLAVNYENGIPNAVVAPSPTESSGAVIDMRGKTITPFIVYEANLKMRGMKPADVLEIRTDKFVAIENDLRAWCRMTGHRLVKLEEGANTQNYFIMKAETNGNKKKLAMVISDPRLDRLIAPLGLALGAALTNTDVHIYFQGPAVRLMKKDYRASLGGFQKLFSSFARNGMAKVGHLPPEEKLKQLKTLDANFYLCGGSIEHFGVKIDDLVYTDVIIAEYFTFLEILDGADIQIYLQ